MEILLAGSVTYWKDEALHAAFGNHYVVIADGSCQDRKTKSAAWFSVDLLEERFEHIFENYNFDCVIYCSSYLTYQREDSGELDRLGRLLQLCHQMHVKQVLFLTSDELCTGTEDDRSIVLRAEEELCRYYREQMYVPVRIVRCPCMAAGNVEQDYWYRMFRSLEEKNCWVFKAASEQPTDFLDIMDLAELLSRMTENWNDGEQVMNLHGYSKSSFGDLAFRLKQKYPGAEIRCREQTQIRIPDMGTDVIRQRYGWFARVDVVSDFEKYYRQYQEMSHPIREKKGHFREKLLVFSKFRAVLELAGGAVLVEILLRLFGTTVQFQMIDVRLLFVVCMACVYGMNTGLAAAATEIVSLGYGYYKEGMDWALLFYEPSNWLAFLLYLTVGAICGYIKVKKEEELGFEKKEHDLLKEKYVFVSRLYQEALAYKNQYKKQIISSRDSFGRIFEVVKQLDAMIPEKIFAEAIPVLEDVLENQSVAIYSITDASARYARLEVCSGQMGQTLSKSLKLEDYEKMLETIQKEGVWFNQELLEGYPMYAAGLKRENVLIVLILVYHVEYIQVGLYYANLIRVLSGLIETSFARAWEYQNTISARKYVGDTMILREEYFVQQLEIHHSMYENRLSSYCLFCADPAGRTIEEMDKLLQHQVRKNDLIGLGKDGNIYILLNQMDQNYQELVMNRFASLGLKCRVVTGAGEKI